MSKNKEKNHMCLLIINKDLRWIQDKEKNEQHSSQPGKQQKLQKSDHVPRVILNIKGLTFQLKGTD